MLRSPGGIDPVTHGAAGKDTGADIVPDRITREAAQHGGPVRHLGAADRAQRKQIVEGQRQVAGGDEESGDEEGPPVGQPPVRRPARRSPSRAGCGRARTAATIMTVTLSTTPSRLKPIFALKTCARCAIRFSIPRSRTAIIGPFVGRLVPPKPPARRLQSRPQRMAAIRLTFWGRMVFGKPAPFSETALAERDHGARAPRSRHGPRPLAKRMVGSASMGQRPLSQRARLLLTKRRRPRLLPPEI